MGISPLNMPRRLPPYRWPSLILMLQWSPAKRSAPKLLPFPVCALFALLPVYCGVSVAGEVSFEQRIQPIFDDHCVICHMTGSENAGLNLERGMALSQLVGIPSTESKLPRVSPGGAANSYLLAKLRGTFLQLGGNGARMPLGGPQLDEADINLIEQWISAGASAQ